MKTSVLGIPMPRDPSPLLFCEKNTRTSVELWGGGWRLAVARRLNATHRIFTAPSSEQ